MAILRRDCPVWELEDEEFFPVEMGMEEKILAKVPIFTKKFVTFL
jgi:hypothetical protein